MCILTLVSWSGTRCQNRISVLPGDLPLGSQLSPCHFSAYSAWVVQTYFAPAVQTSTLHVSLRFYSVSTVPVSLPCGMETIPLFRPLSAHATDAFQCLLCFQSLGLISLRCRNPSAVATDPCLLCLCISALHAVSRLEVSLDCGGSTHALYLAFSAYLTSAFRFLLCDGISALTGVSAVQVLRCLSHSGLTWLTTSLGCLLCTGDTGKGF